MIPFIMDRIDKSSRNCVFIYGTVYRLLIYTVEHLCKIFLKVKGRLSVKLTVSLHLLLRLRMHGPVGCGVVCQHR